MLLITSVEKKAIKELESFSCFQEPTSGFYTWALKYITSFVADLRSITGAEHDHCKLKTRFEMFRKSNLNFVLICLLFQSTASASVKPKNFSGVKSNFSNSHDLPETVDQTFNINNWGLGKIERKLLLDIKAKVDSFFSKCKGMFEHLNIGASTGKIISMVLGKFLRSSFMIFLLQLSHFCLLLFQRPFQSVQKAGFRVESHVTS